MTDVHWNAAALEELLNSPTGPVGQMLIELSEQVAATARSTVRVRHTPTWTAESDARPPGYTLASIRPHLGYNSRGHIYGGANAAADPTIFLEQPAEQLHHRYPFMTTALWSVASQL